MDQMEVLGKPTDPDPYAFWRHQSWGINSAHKARIRRNREYSRYIKNWHSSFWRLLNTTASGAGRSRRNEPIVG